MIGCDCAVCHSPDPRDQRLRSSIYVETPESSWVVDTGTDFRTQALRENIRHIDAVIFTHSHTDHIMGFDDLRRFAYQRGYMPVYAPAETMQDLERVFEFAFKALNPFPGYLKPEPHVVTEPFTLGSTLITPLPVPHGNSTEVEALIIDALRHKPHPTHLSVAQALAVAERVRPAKTYFTHICHELPQAAESQLPADTHIAYDGLKLKF